MVVAVAAAAVVSAAAVVAAVAAAAVAPAAVVVSAAAVVAAVVVAAVALVEAGAAPQLLEVNRVWARQKLGHASWEKSYLRMIWTTKL